jgi:hypothetical protein
MVAIEACAYPGGSVSPPITTLLVMVFVASDPPTYELGKSERSK